MVKRKISRDNYIIAGVITLLVFGLGITLGVVLDNARLEWIAQDSQVQEADQRSIQFVYAYLSSLEEEESNCQVMQIALDNAVKDLGESLEAFTNYEDQTTFNQRSYDVNSRRYIIDNLRYWWFAKQNKERCKSNFVPILYFYSDDDCSNCPDQGKILTYYKKLFQERVLVFPINVDREGDEPAITIIKGQYNVTSVPTIVVDDTAYSGIRYRDDVREYICSSFTTTQEECV